MSKLQGNVSMISVAYDNSYLACGMNDGSVNIVTYTSHTLEVNPNPIPSIHFLSRLQWLESGKLATIGSESLKIWNFIHMKPVEAASFPLQEDISNRIRSWFFLEDTSCLVWSNEEKELWKHDLKERTKLRLGYKAQMIDRIGVKGVFGLTHSQYVKIISANSPSEDLYQHKAQISSLATTAESRFILSASFDKSIILYDLESKLRIEYIKDAHSRAVRSIAVAPNGEFFVSGCMDGSFKIFDLQSRKESGSVNAHSEAISNVLITSDSNEIITCSKDKTIKVFEVSTKKLKHEFKNIHKEFINATALTSDDKFLIAGDNEGVISIYNLELSKFVHIFRQVGTGPINTIATGQDNKTFIVGMNSGQMKIFDLQEKAEVYKFPRSLDYNINCIKISSDGRYIVTGDSEGRIVVYEYNKKQQVQQYTID